MTDLSLTIEAKSDQLNADDLIGGPRTIRITRVTGRDTADQPIAISFEGDNGKPYLPCKTMRRLLVHVWKKDGTKYAGRSMTLYRDPDVQFGGLKVGGIRISHVTDIDAPMTVALTATRGNKRATTVKPLKVDQSAPKFDTAVWENACQSKITGADDADELTAWWNSPQMMSDRKSAHAVDPSANGSYARIKAMFTDRVDTLTGGV